MHPISRASRGCLPSFPPSNTLKPFLSDAIVPVGQAFMHPPHFKQRSKFITGTSFSLSIETAPSAHEPTQASQSEHISSVIVGKTAPIIPISFIWGWEQAFIRAIRKGYPEFMMKLKIALDVFFQKTEHIFFLQKHFDSF